MSNRLRNMWHQMTERKLGIIVAWATFLIAVVLVTVIAFNMEPTPFVVF